MKDQSEVETARAPNRDACHDLWALVVSGPAGESCHLLPPRGLVKLGRADQSDIVLDDATASRSHAVLQIADTVMLSDLGSANGTFVGEQRLLAGTAQTLQAGESFRIGDLTLLLRPSGLKALGRCKVVTREELPARFSATRPVADCLVMRAKVQRARDRGSLEIIIAHLGAMSSSKDAVPVVVRLGECHAGLIVPLAGPNTTERDSNAAALKRRIMEHLDRWGLRAHLDTITLNATSPGEISEAARRFFEDGSRKNDGAPRPQELGKVIIHDRAMDEVRRTVDAVARFPVPVLILGETGVGKDIFASMLHELSPRGHRPFVRINCASLPENLLESELFGHERGAFTGASHAKAGLLETANGGTAFLDEIGELAPSLQAKLLTAIERREVTRIGALQARAIDLRFVAATNRHLPAEVEAGRFRSDLFYRLQLVTLTVPPLRDRPADIEPLARHFLDQARILFDLPLMKLSAAAIGVLQEWPWPGNVRELRNVMERAALLSGATVIEPDHLGLARAAGPATRSATLVGQTPRPAFSDLGSDLEKRSIQAALSECGGNQSRAAQVLRISRRTLVRKIARLGLRRPLDRTENDVANP